MPGKKATGVGATPAKMKAAAVMVGAALSVFGPPDFGGRALLVKRENSDNGTGQYGTDITAKKDDALSKDETAAVLYFFRLSPIDDDMSFPEPSGILGKIGFSISMRDWDGTETTAKLPEMSALLFELKCHSEL